MNRNSRDSPRAGRPRLRSEPRHGLNWSNTPSHCVEGVLVVLKANQKGTPMLRPSSLIHVGPQNRGLGHLQCPRMSPFFSRKGSFLGLNGKPKESQNLCWGVALFYNIPVHCGKPPSALEKKKKHQSQLKTSWTPVGVPQRPCFKLTEGT